MSVTAIAASNAALAAASASIAASSVANSNKLANMKNSCVQFVEHFDSSIATVEQKRAYADCIIQLYNKSSTSDVMLLKAIIFSAFIGMIVGAFLCARDSYSKNDGAAWFFFVLAGFVLGSAFPMFFYGAYKAIVFLFTA